MFDVIFLSKSGSPKVKTSNYYHLIIDSRLGEKNSTCAGILAGKPEGLDLGDYVYIIDEGTIIFAGLIRSFEPRIGIVKKLIRNKYFTLRNVFVFEAEFNPAIIFNESLSSVFENMLISDILKYFVNSLKIPLFYTVDYSGTYGEGQVGEYQKFLSRKDSLSEYIDLYYGDLICSGRIDASAAIAEDGRTIGGLKIDGAVINDVIMIGIAPESLTIDGALERHPELEGMGQAEYEKTEYYALAVQARDWLQDEIDEHGIDYIEINWHLDEDGLPDSRMDRNDRLQVIIYTYGRCLNVGQIEMGYSPFAAPESGFSYPAEILMKEWISYRGKTTASLDRSERLIDALSFFEENPLGVIDLLARLAGNYYWKLIPYPEPRHITGYNSPLACCLEWRCASGRVPDKIVRYDSKNMSFDLKSGVRDLYNIFNFYGGNLDGEYFKRHFENQASVIRYGPRAETIVVPGIISDQPANWLETALLSDFAGIRDEGFIVLRCGGIDIMPGDSLKLSGYEAEGEAFDSPEYGMFKLDESALDAEAGLDGDIHRAGRVRKYISHGSVKAEVHFQGGYSSLSDPLRYLRGNPDGVTEEEMNYLDSRTGSFKLDLSVLDTNAHLD